MNQIRERIDTNLQPGAAATAERAREAAEQARLRAAEAAEQTRVRTAEAKVRAAAAAEQAKERAGEAAEHTRGWLSDAGEAMGPFLGRILAVLSNLFGSLAERGREAAARVEEPSSLRRRRRLKTAGWFAGGFTLGAVAGWLLHARLQGEPQSPETIYGDLAGADEAGDSPYGKEAEAIDARRENAPFG